MEFLRMLLEDTTWMTGVSAVVGSIVTYLVTRTNKSKDISINDRMQLSKDQYQLIAELREMMQEQRGEIDKLRDQIKELQVVNTSLILENKELQSKISELNFLLSKFDS